MSAAAAPLEILKPGKLPRRPELDALRGLFLVWMTLTHLPTHLSDFVNQPFGFISSAEGFVFLSALLVGRLYIRKAAEDSRALRTRLWKRSAYLYGYQLAMLAIAFTAAAAFAMATHRPALYNLLDFYLAHPATAIVGSVLLIYRPPLLDILPIYIIFLAVTPLLLSFAARKGWSVILAASGIVWLAAQFGLRNWAQHWMVCVTGLHIPVQEMGAFNLFGWQLVWTLGMWLGAQSATGGNPFARLPRWAYAVAAAVCVFFIGVRHDWLGAHLTQQALGMLLDKWRIGALRLLNLTAFACLVYLARGVVARLGRVGPLVTLGKASLEVFCAHIVFVFFGLALLYGEMEQLHGFYAVLLVAVTFTGLMLVAMKVNQSKPGGQGGSPARQPAPTFEQGALSSD